MVQKTKRGRPAIDGDSESITLTMAREDVALAETLVPALERLALGVKHSRLDVLRAAVRRGLAAMKAEIDTQK